MIYLMNLVIIGVYLMLEIKFDQQIRANIGTYNTQLSGKLMHSIWQNAGRGVMICGIIWNQPMDQDIIALATFLMYALFYWAAFDSVFAAGVLNKKPWFLGTTANTDKLFPKWSHFYVWLLKWAAFGGSVWWVIKLAP